MVSDAPQYQPAVYPNSPKRKRETLVLQPSGITTPNLNTAPSRKFSDAGTDDTLSPRGIVSVKMQGLHLRASLSPTRGINTGPSSRNTDSDWRTYFQHTPDESSATEEPHKSSIKIAEPSQDDDKTSFRHGDVFQFKAGNRPGAALTSPFKRTSFVDDDVGSISSPSKRQRCRSPSMSPPPQAVPRCRSPSARRLLHRSPPPSEISSSPSEAELAQFWWQPSEIVGHDPDDPEEDNRGVNGIGYQKTKAEQWRISEKKKRQISEWRLREAKEARSLRAGGRRVMMGRVSKPGSRAGSPSDSTARGRSSPVPRSVSDEKRMEEVVRRAVRFDLG